MIHIHPQSNSADYRLRIPRLIDYTIAFGSAMLALGIGHRTSIPNHQNIAMGAIGVGAISLIPALALRAFIPIFQKARERLRDRLLTYQWRGDEAVLDVGTGSGFLLFECAKHLDRGKATGIDIYDPNAGGSTAENFWRNAQIEGVTNRVELLNLDARTMSFPDQSFDLIVSSLAMHHIGAAEDRRRATREMIRVLKPGGRLALCDLAAVVGDCEQILQQSAMINIQRHQYLHLFSIVSAEKER